MPIWLVLIGGKRRKGTPVSEEKSVKKVHKRKRLKKKDRYRDETAPVDVAMQRPELVPDMRRPCFTPSAEDSSDDSWRFFRRVSSG
jgi:hypothetical protein